MGLSYFDILQSKRFLLKSQTKFTQKWMGFYSKVDGILLKSEAKFTQKCNEIYSKV
jgi:hypothetical protein